MTDEYETLRAAFHAGATIQAFTVEGEDGSTSLRDLDPLSYRLGYWRDLSCDGEPKFSCHPTRYRVKPESRLRDPERNDGTTFVESQA